MRLSRPQMFRSFERFLKKVELLEKRRTSVGLTQDNFKMPHETLEELNTEIERIVADYFFLAA